MDYLHGGRRGISSITQQDGDRKLGDDMKMNNEISQSSSTILVVL